MAVLETIVVVVGVKNCFFFFLTFLVPAMRKPQEIKLQSGKNVIEHPPVFIFTTCASIFEKIGKGLETKWILR